MSDIDHKRPRPQCNYQIITARSLGSFRWQRVR